MVVSEYDGDQHRTNRRQYTKDIARPAQGQKLGWIVDQVIKEDTGARTSSSARRTALHLDGSAAWKL